MYIIAIIVVDNEPLQRRMNRVTIYEVYIDVEVQYIFLCVCLKFFNGFDG